MQEIFPTKKFTHLLDITQVEGIFEPGELTAQELEILAGLQTMLQKKIVGNSNYEDISSSEIQLILNVLITVLKKYKFLLEEKGVVTNDMYLTLFCLTNLCTTLLNNTTFIESQGTKSLVITSTLNNIKTHSRQLMENASNLVIVRSKTRAALQSEVSRFGTNLHILILAVTRLSTHLM